MFRKPKRNEDWKHFFGNYDSDETGKDRLIAACRKSGVVIYIDDPSETSKGQMADLRAVASEAELWRRLQVNNARIDSRKANSLAMLAIAISLVSLSASLLEFFNV